MKKIKYLIIALMLLIVPCFSKALENEETPISVSDIKVSKIGETDVLSFKLLKDLNLNKGDFIVLTNYDNEGYNYQRLFLALVNNKIRNDGFKIATGDSCETTKEIEGNTIDQDTTLCFSKENTKIDPEAAVLKIAFEEGNKLENIPVRIGANAQLYEGEEMYGEMMCIAIEEYYDHYVQIRAGSDEGIQLTFYPDQWDDYEKSSDIGFLELQKDKTLQDYVKIIDNMLSKANIDFSIKSISAESKMVPSLLKGIKMTKQKAFFDVKEGDKILYSWIFDGSKIDNTDYNIDLSLKIGESTNKTKIENLVKNKKESLVLEFGYHGLLPLGTSVNVNVSDKYQNNDILSLYYYNDKGELELTSKDIKVENGFATLNLEHCSEYVLVKENSQNSASNNAQTSSMNIILYIGVAITSLASIIYIIIKKKEIA